MCQIVSDSVTIYVRLRHNMCQILSQYVSDNVTIYVRLCHNMCPVLYLTFWIFPPFLKRPPKVAHHSIKLHFRPFYFIQSPCCPFWSSFRKSRQKEEQNIIYIIFYFVTWCNTFDSKYQLYRKKTEFSFKLGNTSHQLTVWISICDWTFTIEPVPK